MGPYPGANPVVKHLRQVSAPPVSGDAVLQDGAVLVFQQQNALKQKDQTRQLKDCSEESKWKTREKIETSHGWTCLSDSYQIKTN